MDEYHETIREEILHDNIASAAMFFDPYVSPPDATWGVVFTTKTGKEYMCDRGGRELWDLYKSRSSVLYYTPSA